jgi:hypothetical protein
MLDYELSWDGPNYSRQDNQGTYGTITFAENGLVGVFRDEHSPRAPWHSGAEYDLAQRLAGMPADLVALAEREALQYVFDEHQGQVGPIITAAFWSADDEITAAEPWLTVVEHGAHLVQIEAMETEAAIAEWQQEYEWDAAEVTLLRSLFTRRLATLGRPMVIETWERDAVLAKGSEGIEAAREVFAALNIVLL